MDVLILAAGLSSRLTNYTHNLIPKYLIDIDENTGLYHIIKYWYKYAKNIFLVIHYKYNIITNFYIKNILDKYQDKIKIINYNNSDGTAYTINYLLNNDLVSFNIKNLLITWCDLYPLSSINFSKIENNRVPNNIHIFTYGNNCRFMLNDKNNIIERKESDGNIIGIYYIQNYTKFTLDNDCLNKDIVSYLSIIGEIYNFPIENIIDYGDENKLLSIINNSFDLNSLKCRYFNEINIIDEHKIIKKGITDKGKELIKNECLWYEHIKKINNKIIDYLPKIYNIYESAYIMEYKKKFITISLYFSEYEKNIDILSETELDKNINNEELNIYKNQILKNIFNKLDKLHNLDKKTETRISFFSNLKKEIYDKMYERKKIIEPLLNYFGEINVVNNINIKTFDEVIDNCRNIIVKYYDALSIFDYSIIMGDCQFSNILINPSNIDDIIFIDPRGYFGNSKIYGPIDYDIAKILYAISGYDTFNNNYFNIKNIDIENKSIDFNIKSIKYDKKIIDKYFNKVHKAFMVIIWLGLAEYNKNNIWKCIASYYYGLYLGTLLQH
jgi:hypothetical protein